MKKNKKETYSIQDWFIIDEFFEEGIVKTKKNKYIKILKVNPINYNLKSELEKKAILNSYKTFLKSCNFDLQIIIQSNKEDLTTHINKIKDQNKKEKSFNRENMINLSEKYIKYINQKNKEKLSSSKNFFILISFQKNNENNSYQLIKQELQEQYLKIKDLLSRCGNEVKEVKNKNELKNIYYSFFNIKKYFYEEKNKY